MILHRSCWQNESSTEMIKQPLVSGHVSSVYLSKSLQRGLGNERGLSLEGIPPKQCQITQFSFSSPSTMGMSESSICHSIPRWPLDPTTNWCLLSCHLLSLPCLGVLRQITHSFLKKCRVGVLHHGMCRGIYSAPLKLMTPNGSYTEIVLFYNHQVDGLDCVP